MGGSGYVQGKPHRELDNFFPCVIKYDGLTFSSSEALYQALKFVSPNYRCEIAAETDPFMAWSMGQSREHRLIDRFEEKKEQLMFTANYEKYRQNPDLRAVLLATGDEQIHFYASTDYWNAVNGKILAELRTKLRNEFPK